MYCEEAFGTINYNKGHTWAIIFLRVFFLILSHKISKSTRRTNKPKVKCFTCMFLLFASLSYVRILNYFSMYILIYMQIIITVQTFDFFHTILPWRSGESSHIGSDVKNAGLLESVKDATVRHHGAESAPGSYHAHCRNLFSRKKTIKNFC